MGNSWKQFHIFSKETNIEASAADVFTWAPKHPIRITDVGIIIVDEVVATATTAAVASFDLTAPPASRVEKAAITIPSGTAIGTELVASISSTGWAPFEMSVGDTLIIEQKVQGVHSSTATGEWMAIVYYELMTDGVV